jgi:urocanate hydratase
MFKLIRHHTDDCAAYPPLSPWADLSGGLLQSTQENVVTRFTTPFGFHTTAAEVVAGIDLTGKKAIVTGGAGGIGAETARALAAAGASRISKIDLIEIHSARRLTRQETKDEAAD